MLRPGDSLFVPAFWFHHVEVVQGVVEEEEAKDDARDVLSTDAQGQDGEDGGGGGGGGGGLSVSINVFSQV